VRNNIPHNWIEAKIGELFEMVGGGTPSTKTSEYWNGDTPWITSADILEDHRIAPRRTVSTRGIAESATNKVPVGTIIVATRVGLGKAAVAKASMSFSQDCQGLIVPGKHLDSNFLVYQIETITSEFIRQSQGTTIRGITKKALADLKLRIAPTQEQHRIVEAIESYLTRLDAAVALLERVQRNLKRYRASVLKAAVEGRLVPTEAEIAKKEGRTYEPASKLLAAMPPNSRVRRGVPESVEIRECLRSSVVPDGWALVSVADLLRRGVLLDVKDGNHGTNHPHKNDFSDKGLPFITASQMRDFEIDYEGAPKIAGDPLEKLKVGFAQADDVILSHKGTVGRVAVCTKPCVLTPQTTYYRPNQQILLSSYLAIHHASPIYQMQLAANKSQTTRDFVPIRKQYTLFVLVPPIEEQKRIVTVVESHLSRQRFMQKTIDEAARRILRLRQSILKWAFEGKLVEQDPNDEPASVLLERIKAERESMQPRKRRRTIRKKKNEPTKHDEQLDLLGGTDT